MVKPVNKTLRIAAMSAGEEIGHVSGTVVTFRGNGDPLRSLLVNIDPVQDLHGYDNPWPAGGGKNLFNGTFLQGYWAYADGKWSSDAHWVTTEKIPCKPSTYYTASADNRQTRWQGFVYYDNNGDFISSQNLNDKLPIGYTAKTPANAAYLIFNIAGKSETTDFISPSDVTHFQIEEGQTATSYAPYSNICPISGFTGLNVHVADGENPHVVDNVYPVSWQSEAGTVYGGTLDVTTGVLTVRPYYGSYNGEPLVGPWISSMDAYAPGATPTTGAQVVDLGGTPITIPLTPQEISTLQGQNNVWADSGDVDVEYIATGGEGGKLALLLRNRKELLIALRKGLSPAEAGLLGSIPSLGGSLSPGVIRPGLNTQEEEEDEKDDA